MSELAEWDSFYVIVGGAAGALIGLQFVVMTLIAEKPSPRIALKWMMVGVEKTGPASAILGDGFSAIRVMTTNCRPISAPAAPPTMT